MSDRARSPTPLVAETNSSMSNHSYLELPGEQFSFDFLSLNRQANETAQNNLDDLYKVINVQQSTINKLTLELTKRSQTIPRHVYEKTLNELEVPKICFILPFPQQFTSLTYFYYKCFINFFPLF